MRVIEQRAATGAVATEQLILPFDKRCKSRLRTRLASGEECGLFIERGSVLRGGDKLVANDGTVIEVIAAAEALMEARSSDALELARVAYHLGNRHVAVQILGGSLRFARDHVLGEMVRGLGLPVSEIEAAFEPESGAYGAPHSHGGEAGFVQGRARIHDHFAAR